MQQQLLRDYELFGYYIIGESYSDSSEMSIDLNAPAPQNVLSSSDSFGWVSSSDDRSTITEENVAGSSETKGMEEEKREYYFDVPTVSGE